MTVWKLLKLFNFSNLSLMIGVTIACFVVFALVYGIVYNITSGSYYAIVSGNKDKDDIIQKAARQCLEKSEFSGCDVPERCLCYSGLRIPSADHFYMDSCSFGNLVDKC